MTKTTEFNTDLFKDMFFTKLKEKSSVDSIASLYYTMFKMFCGGFDFMEEYYKLYNFNPTEGEWFRAFHKLIRQVDFYDNIVAYNIVNKLTEYEEKELIELKHERQIDEKNFIINGSNEEYSTWYNTDYYKLRQKRIAELARLQQSRENVDIGGNLDSILYNIIVMDEKNVLYDTMSYCFRFHNAHTK